MYVYIAFSLLLISFIFYYLNIDLNKFTSVFNKNKENLNGSDINKDTVDISLLESSVNELKNLNQYIDNGNAITYNSPI